MAFHINSSSMAWRQIWHCNWAPRRRISRRRPRRDASASTNGSAFPGAFCSRTRRTSRRCAPPSLARWPGSERVRPAQRQNPGLKRRSGFRPRQMGARHRGCHRARAELPARWRQRSDGGQAIRHAAGGRGQHCRRDARPPRIRPCAACS